MTVTRLLAVHDAEAMSSLLRRNRAFLAPWQPLRPERFFTDEGQQEATENALRQHARGTSVPLVIVDRLAEVVGTITLQSVIRGAFQSCSVGYWLSEHAQGQGLATTALREGVHMAFAELGLHRVQAETLPSNTASQRVLERVGFVHYGSANAYMKIAGDWQDHHLYQLLTPTLEQIE